MAETPLMKQYYEMKQQNPEAVLLFRVGDFYETFGDDAVFTSKALNIVLTRRGSGTPEETALAGFPYHAIDNYLPKLVRAGRKVAICEQLEDPRFAKKLIKRGVTELITPGVAISENLLEGEKNNFLASLYMPNPNKTELCGLSLLDISTGEFYVIEDIVSEIKKQIDIFSPSEILVSKPQLKFFEEKIGNNYFFTKLDDWVFGIDYAREVLERHFRVNSLKGFGVEELQSAIVSAGASIHYLLETKHDGLAHISSIRQIFKDKYLYIDKSTARNLELFSSAMPQCGDFQKDTSLYACLNQNCTPMGSRLLRKYLAMPLQDKAEIENRLDYVEYLCLRSELRYELRQEFRQIGDLERMLSKISALRLSPREVLQLSRALKSVQKIKERLSKERDILKNSNSRLNHLEALQNLIDTAIDEEAPNMLSKGGVIKTGFSQELDQYRKIANGGEVFLEELKAREIANTDINSLKIGFNSIFGYYLEVGNAHKNKVPASWVRKQTLSNAERYITQELKEYEEKQLLARDNISSLENTLYTKVLQDIQQYLPQLQTTAQEVAFLDVMSGFAEISQKNNYCKPKILTSDILQIEEGRHPVIECFMKDGEVYIPNSLSLSTSSTQIMMITGPNMSGKSAVLRQTALIVIMAQMGCFVPATAASIGIVDRVFTRVGASDNIASGESTFMVEMNETANILNNISPRSLVLLDEIGRGTSTYDGISIAWAIAEYLHQNKKANPKVLFATHYHELNNMEYIYNRIKNYHISVKEAKDEVIFLRKLERGSSQHSFGIHVARMAGMPRELVNRADKILENMENRLGGDISMPNVGYKQYSLSFPSESQMESLAADAPMPLSAAASSGSCDVSVAAAVVASDVADHTDSSVAHAAAAIPDHLQKLQDYILSIDLNATTPLEALNKLNEAKALAEA